MKNFIQNHKKLVYTLAGFLLILVVYFVQQKSNPSSTNSSPTTAIPTPKFNSIYTTGKPPISINLLENFTPPSTLPIYSLQPFNMSDAQITEIAKNFGFTSTPFISADDETFGKTFVYYSNTQNLRIVPSQGIIDYKNNLENLSFFSQIPSDDVLFKKAIEILLQYKIISNSSDVDPLKIVALSVGEGGHIDQFGKSNVINVAFSKRLNSYPLLASTAETGTVSVSFNSTLNLNSIYLDDVSSVTEDKKIPLKDLKEITETAQNEATIQSINDGKMDIIETNSQNITNITINSISIAYIQELDQNQRYLQPVYVLKGTASFKSRPNTNITLYLPAISTKTSEIQN